MLDQLSWQVSAEQTTHQLQSGGAVKTKNNPKLKLPLGTDCTRHRHTGVRVISRAHTTTDKHLTACRGCACMHMLHVQQTHTIDRHTTPSTLWLPKPTLTHCCRRNNGPWGCVAVCTVSGQYALSTGRRQIAPRGASAGDKQHAPNHASETSAAIPSTTVPTNQVWVGQARMLANDASTALRDAS